MSELFERLSRLSAAPTEPAIASQPVNVSASSDSEALLEKLRHLGDKRQVNPPKEAPATEAEVQKAAEAVADIIHKEAEKTEPLNVIVPEKSAVESTRPTVMQPAANVPDAPAEAVREVCPHCKKDFKVLALHKCKYRPAAPSYNEQGPAAPDMHPPVTAVVGEQATVTVAVGKESLFEKMKQETVGTVQAAEGKVVEVDQSLFEKMKRENTWAQDEIKKTAALGAEQVMYSAEALVNAESLAEQVAKTDHDLTNKGKERLAELTAGELVEESDLDGFVLMLDAVFVKHQFGNGVKHFTDIIAPLAESICIDKDVGHWALLDYAKGGPALAAQLASWIKDTNPQGVFLVDSSTAEARACMTVLKQHAKVIIQGIR